MKLSFLFFICLTAVQVIFAGVYFFFGQKMNLTLLMENAIYPCAIMESFQSYPARKYQQKKKELLGSLP